jgi:hypothetical protein
LAHSGMWFRGAKHKKLAHLALITEPSHPRVRLLHRKINIEFDGMISRPEVDSRVGDMYRR